MPYASKNDLGHAPGEGQVFGPTAAFEACKQAIENLGTGRPFSADAKLRMFESYEGVVKHADDDQVVVVYEVEEDLVEQTYIAKQFIDGKLPEVGDRLAVFVYVAQLPVESTSSDSIRNNVNEDDDDDVVPLPREF